MIMTRYVLQKGFLTAVPGDLGHNLTLLEGCALSGKSLLAGCPSPRSKNPGSDI